MVVTWKQKWVKKILLLCQVLTKKCYSSQTHLFKLKQSMFLKNKFFLFFFLIFLNYLFLCQGCATWNLSWGPQHRLGHFCVMRPVFHTVVRCKQNQTFMRALCKPYHGYNLLLATRLGLLLLCFGHSLAISNATCHVMKWHAFELQPLYVSSF